MEVETTGLSISLVPQEQIGKIWHKVAPFLKKATDMSEGRYELADLGNKLITDPDWHLWLVFEPGLKIVAAITSTFTFYPQGKFLHGQFLGGTRLEEWQDQFCDVFDNWGRDHDCTAVEFTGRTGWAKKLSRNGYREVFRIYQRDL